MLDDNGQPVTEFVNATIEQVNDENDNPVEYYIDMAALMTNWNMLVHRIPPQRIRLEKRFRAAVFTASTKDMLYSAKFRSLVRNAEYSIIKKQTQYDISRYQLYCGKVHPHRQ